MDHAELRTLLESVASLLEAGHEHHYAVIVRNALCGSDRSLEDFLESNELWGGAGSIADQSLSSWSVARRELESVLIQLGQVQQSIGISNVRTKSWVAAFESWRQLGRQG